MKGNQKKYTTIEHYTDLDSLRKAWGLKPIPDHKKIKVDYKNNQ